MTQSSKQRLHEAGYMTHDEALWYHRIVDALRLIALIIVGLVLFHFFGESLLRALATWLWP